MSGCSFVTLRENNSFSLPHSFSLSLSPSSFVSQYDNSTITHHVVVSLLLQSFHVSSGFYYPHNLYSFSIYAENVYRLSRQTVKKVTRYISNKTTCNKIYFIPCFKIYIYIYIYTLNNIFSSVSVWKI